MERQVLAGRSLGAQQPDQRDPREAGGSVARRDFLEHLETLRAATGEPSFALIPSRL